MTWATYGSFLVFAVVIGHGPGAACGPAAACAAAPDAVTGVALLGFSARPAAE